MPVAILLVASAHHPQRIANMFVHKQGVDFRDDSDSGSHVTACPVPSDLVETAASASMLCNRADISSRGNAIIESSARKFVAACNGAVLASRMPGAKNK